MSATSRLGPLFSSLRAVNYRIWFAGALVSNIGAWMQRTAQDWLVLTELTTNDAFAVGVVVALQFGPMALLMPVAGVLADRVPGRRLLACTQIAQCLLALGLGTVVLLGIAELWMVYGFALGLGVVNGIESPARHTFVGELVSIERLPNAVALNSASFNTARLTGPAIAGFLTVIVGTGWIFMINAATFAAVLVALWLIREDEMFPIAKVPRERGQLRAALSYVNDHPDIRMALILVFLVGTFGLNFPIILSTMARVEFDRGPAEYGMLFSILAVGSVAAALAAAWHQRPRIGVIVCTVAAFGAACLVASFMPTYETFAISLVLVGFASLATLTIANGFVQVRTDPNMRGRLMAFFSALHMGGTPIGAPLVGVVVNEFGPRWGMGVASAAGLLGAIIGVIWLLVSRRRQPNAVRRRGRRFRRGKLSREAAVYEISVSETNVRKT